MIVLVNGFVSVQKFNKNIIKNHKYKKCDSWNGNALKNISNDEWITDGRSIIFTNYLKNKTHSKYAKDTENKYSHSNDNVHRFNVLKNNFVDTNLYDLQEIKPTYCIKTDSNTILTHNGKHQIFDSVVYFDNEKYFSLDRLSFLCHTVSNYDFRYYEKNNTLWVCEYKPLSGSRICYFILHGMQFGNNTLSIQELIDWCEN